MGCGDATVDLNLPMFFCRGGGMTRDIFDDKRHLRWMIYC